jgi:type IV pilus assembly protein PilO
MDISLSKLPWYGQIGAFVVMSALSIYGFYTYYVSDVQAELQVKETRLTSLRADINKGVATARRLNEFQTQVTDLERRLDALKNVLPEQKDVADTLRRIQGLATQSNLSIQRFTPQAAVQQAMYAEVPFKLQAEGTYHNLGFFFDRVSKFPRIINIGEISIRPKSRQEPNATIVAECTATTFVLQEGAAPAAKGGKVVPKQPGAR